MLQFLRFVSMQSWYYARTKPREVDALFRLVLLSEDV
jgi:hypothetical protein